MYNTPDEHSTAHQPPHRPRRSGLPDPRHHRLGTQDLACPPGQKGSRGDPPDLEGNREGRRRVPQGNGEADRDRGMTVSPSTAPGKPK